MPELIQSNADLESKLIITPTRAKKAWWKWLALGGVLVLVTIMSSYLVWFNATSDDEEVWDRKILPLVPKAVTNESVSAEYAVYQMGFMAQKTESSEEIEILTEADWVRVPGSMKIFYNRTDKDELFVNGSILSIENNKLKINWEGHELIMNLSPDLQLIKANGQEIAIEDISANVVAQIVMSVGVEDRSLLVNKILLL
jgi:hypothetical protein